MPIVAAGGDGGRRKVRCHQRYTWQSGQDLPIAHHEMGYAVRQDTRDATLICHVPARVGGLMERALFIEILAWYVAFGWQLFQGMPGDQARQW